MASSAHHGGKIREEAAMATITFDTANRKEHVRERRETVRPTAAITRQGERPGIVPAEQPAAVSAQFQPLDPDIVNEAVPAFFIGRNKEGFLDRPRRQGPGWRNFPVPVFRAGVCKAEEPASGVRNDISIREVRTRPGKQRQSAGAAPQAGDPPFEAASPAVGRRHRKDEGCGQAPAEATLRLLKGRIARARRAQGSEGSQI
jgi:hypothetical protein